MRITRAMQRKAGARRPYHQQYSTRITRPTPPATAILNADRPRGVSPPSSELLARICELLRKPNPEIPPATACLQTNPQIARMPVLYTKTPYEDANQRRDTSTNVRRVLKAPQQQALQKTPKRKRRRAIRESSNCNTQGETLARRLPLQQQHSKLNARPPGVSPSSSSNTQTSPPPETILKAKRPPARRLPFQQQQQYSNVSPSSNNTQSQTPAHPATPLPAAILKRLHPATILKMKHPSAGRLPLQ